MGLGDYHSSSKDHTWGTPDYIYEYAVNRWGSFQLDGAGSEENKKCDHVLTIERNALVGDWDIAPGISNVWLNPPYGRSLLPFAEKVIEQVHTRKIIKRVVLLVPARTDTRWFNLLASNACEVVFFKGRIKFNGAESSAPFPSCFIVIDQFSRNATTQYGLVI